MAVRILVIAVVMAAVAIAAFGTLAWRNISVEQVDEVDARHRFASVRTRFADQEPVIRLDEGRRIRRPMPAAGAASPGHLIVLAYRAGSRRLVTARLPFWFLKMKGPAVQLSLRDTGLDLEQLGVTPSDLERYGPALILDESRPGGDHVLVWTE